MSLKIIVARVILCCAYLSGCSGGNNDNEPECGSNESCPPPNPAENIVGLWDRSVQNNLGTDVVHSYIGADRTFLIYDFQQDDFGNGENCHRLNAGIISRVDSVSFTYNIQTEDRVDMLGVTEVLEISRQGSNLRVIRESGLEEIWVSLEGVSREDLALCE